MVEPIHKKTCRKCERILPVSEFYPHPETADGRLNFCRMCVKSRTREYRKRRNRGETTPRPVGRQAPDLSHGQRLAKRGILVKRLTIFAPAGRPEALHDRLVRLSKATCQSQKEILFRAIELYLDFLEKKLSDTPRS